MPRARGAARLRPLPVAVGAGVEQLASCLDDRAGGGERERATHRYPAHSQRRELRNCRRSRQREHVHGPVDGGQELPELVGVGDGGRVEHVGAGLLVGLEPDDGVGEVAPTVEVVLGTGGDDEAAVAGVGDLDRGSHALCRRRRLVERIVGPAGEVLDREPGEPGTDGECGRLRDARGVVGEAVLEIGRHREVGGRHDGGGVRDRLVAGHGAVEATERAGEATARRGQRLEAERRQELRRARIPGVRQQERVRPLVQGTEARHLLHR